MYGFRSSNPQWSSRVISWMRRREEGGLSFHGHCHQGYVNCKVRPSLCRRHRYFATSSPASAGRLGAGVPAARWCFGKHEIRFTGRSNKHNHLLFLLSGGYLWRSSSSSEQYKGKSLSFLCQLYRIYVLERLLALVFSDPSYWIPLPVELSSDDSCI